MSKRKKKPTVAQAAMFVAARIAETGGHHRTAMNILDAACASRVDPNKVDDFERGLIVEYQKTCGE